MPEEKKLRTLNDLQKTIINDIYEKPMSDDPLIFILDLKQAAIEWYKWHDKKSYRDNLSIMEWIKHFFDLEDKDIK